MFSRLLASTIRTTTQITRTAWWGRASWSSSARGTRFRYTCSPTLELWTRGQTGSLTSLGSSSDQRTSWRTQREFQQLQMDIEHWQGDIHANLLSSFAHVELLMCSFWSIYLFKFEHYKIEFTYHICLKRRRWWQLASTEQALSESLILRYAYILSNPTKDKAVVYH